MLKKYFKKLSLIQYIMKYSQHREMLRVQNMQLELAQEQIERLYKMLIKPEHELVTKTAQVDKQKKLIIVSLTSHGERVKTVHQTILSLLGQTVQADKLILWLAADEFNFEQLPRSLLTLQQYGLEIKFCQDIRSYKKLLPTLQMYPNETIITFDDDVIYPVDQIECLLYHHSKYPNAIICHRAHQIKYADNGTILPYIKWDYDVDFLEPRKDIIAIGIGGILYPSQSLHQEVFNQEKFLKLSPYADDLWFKAMAIKNDTLIKVVDNPIPYQNYLFVVNSQSTSLWQENKYNNGQQLTNILNHYPEISDNLNEHRPLSHSK